MKRALLALLLSCVAMADIYKHVDAEGRVTYSNVPMKGAKRIDMSGLPGSIPAPRSGGSSSGGSRASANPSPADFPKVDSATQRSRDLNRRQLLQDEMASEQRLLEQARTELSKATPERAAKLRDDMMHSEKNIEMLQKEINRIK
ncbi:DUF4124 domain-containing protein [Chitinimonas lacunae]|uniref:DUF4124 domain-containing protein n=1 Tax=Chitinimonas lacunae TaxID=1963018 RepID=A0ABV8MP82_9NEIS